MSPRDDDMQQLDSEARSHRSPSVKFIPWRRGVAKFYTVTHVRDTLMDLWYHTIATLKQTGLNRPSNSEPKNSETQKSLGPGIISYLAGVNRRAESRSSILDVAM